ncbi:MAG: spore germination protein [Clostridiaceae bacterium]|nr:spore germination protein [Eubacteriales bacterium]
MLFNIFGNRKKKRDEWIKNATRDVNSAPEDHVFTGKLREDLAFLTELFKDVDILRVRELENRNDKKLRFCLLYCDGMVDSLLLSQTVVGPLVDARIEPGGGGELADTVLKETIYVGEGKKTRDLKHVIDAITYGDTALLIDGSKDVLLLNTKGFHTRAIDEPDSEKTLNGPREGFNESIMQNLSLVRRKLGTPALKMKFLSMGKQSNTRVCVCYLEGIVNKDVLKELYRRLERIDIDAILDSNYISELIRDAPYSPFRTTGYTEKPDVVVGKILEGRIVLFVDGTCNVITLPYLFIENFQSGEDYYLSFFYTSVSRLLRIIGFFATVITPGLYIAVVAFHREMLPQALLINIAAERMNVPLPAALEALVMLVVFDILRETGVRMPSSIGQALSIVGALVIGQAAVEAKLVSSPMIIVVGFTGITNLLVPKMNAPIIYLRLAILALSSLFGFLGLLIGVLVSVIHILNLKSFGVPQVSNIGNLRYQAVKDSAFRAPWWDMLTRPRVLTKNSTRMRVKDGGPNDA